MTPRQSRSRTGNAATLQYTALQVTSDSTVTFTLTVTDDDGATGTLTP